MAEVSIGPSVSEHRFQESEWDDNAGFSMTVMDERSVDEELMTVSVDNETSALRIATDEQSADEELLTISDDNETVYSMDGFDPQFLGPAVEYDSFPPFPEKPIPEKDLPYALLLNKKEYYAYHEATPHDNWFCEYPYCSTTFIPYLVWGTRHHCRSCGISVCCDHSTPNITLSSHILSIYHGDLAAVETPILATSMDESTLPSVVTLKYACLLCSEKALPRTGKEVKATKKASKPIKGPVTVATKEVDQLLFQLHRTQNLLQARMEDVGELAGRVNDFADKNAILRKTVKLLQAQLVIVESGAHRKVLGMQRLNKLKEQVRNLEEKSKAALYYNHNKYNHNTASTTAAARHSNNHNGRSGQDRRSVEFDSDVSSVDNERCGAKDETTFESETATSVGEHSFLEPHLPITLVPSREATYSRYANIVNTACREQVAPANIPAHNGGNAGRSNNTTASTGPTGSATQAAPISHIGTTNASSTSPASASPSIAVAARPTSSSASGASPTSFSSREGALNGAENVDNSAPGAALNRSSPLPMETAVNGEVSPIAARSPALALAPQIERRRLHEELAAEPADPTTPDTVSSAGSVASTRSPFGPAQSAVPTSTPPSRPQQQPTQQQEQYISLVASPAWGRSRFLSPMGSVDSYQSAGGNNNSASRVVAYEDIYATHSADDYDCLRMSDSLRESVGMDVSPQQSSHALGDATAELRASGGERADTGASTSSAGDGDRAGDGDAAAGGSRGDRGGREGHRTDSGHFAPQLLDIYGRQSSVFSMLESESSRSDLDLDLQEGSSAAVGVTRGNAQQQQAVSSSPDQRLADTGISFDDLTYSHTNSTASMMIPSSPQGVTQASQTQAGSRMFGVNPLALKPQRRKSVS